VKGRKEEKKRDLSLAGGERERERKGDNLIRNNNTLLQRERETERE